MPSFNNYQRMSRIGGVTTGQHRTHDAQGIIEATWDDDPSSCVAYLYSYEYDDEPDLNVGMHPEKSKTKIPVDIKYIISNYQSLDKDEVDFRIMFKPSYKCNVPYYKEKFEDLVSSKFPCGLYCDIYDKPSKMWNRWLVVSNANDKVNDFPTWSILPCGHKFQWIYNGKKCEMWGVERSQNS